MTGCDPSTSTQVEDYQLAVARLEWAQLALCADLDSQREPLEWTRACCEAAYAALTGDDRAVLALTGYPTVPAEVGPAPDGQCHETAAPELCGPLPLTTRGS